MKRLCCLLTLIIFVSTSVKSQIVSDSWRDHLNYTNGRAVAASKTKVFCATELSMFYYDKEDHTINHLTPIEGLSEIGIGTIAYSDKNNTLIVGYSNGNIDLIDDDLSIYNMSGLKEKNISTSKNINHINIVDDIAYLSCDFGMTAINIKRKEFSDTYILGTAGSYLKINHSAVFNNYLYAFTDSGLMRGSLDEAFLTDLKNWEYIIINDERKIANTGCTFNGKLYINIPVTGRDSSEVFSFDGKTWQKTWSNNGCIKNMTQGYNKLICTATNNICVYDWQLNIEDKWECKNTNTSIADNNSIWYSNDHGLNKRENGKITTILPDGPDRNEFYKVTYNNGEILIAPGGMQYTGQNNYQRADIYTYNGTNWSCIDRNKFPDIGNCRDIINFATTNDKNHYIATSWRYGLIEYHDGKLTHYNESNTDGHLANNVSSCVFDSHGNLWAISSFNSMPFSVRTAQGVWHRYAYGNILTELHTGKLICTKNDIIWQVSARGNGIFVLDPKGTPEYNSDDDYILFQPTNNDGTSINNHINDIAEDKNGTIWLASDEGVYVYDHPEYILQGYSTNARRPQMVEDGFYQPLLGTEIVNTIAIDDANRKWFGTANGGLFVISPDGTKQYAVYNKSNSPLFSNNVLSIAIDNINGILYIITDKGLQSARISVTKPETGLSNIYAFPNPVEPDFYGDVTIRGLMSETVIKITDLYGNLVFETMSNGGSAVWNVCNMDGKRVETGIYLIQCITSDGQSKGVGKIHVIK